LQLSPAALLQLAEMGFSEREAQRGLRFSGSDLAAAVDFLTEQRQREQVRTDLQLPTATNAMNRRVRVQHAGGDSFCM
jgi:uncharacterized UBP type Zn finger protein